MTTNPLSSVVGWLRKGYPEGVPPKDFPPLLALLQRSLTPDEVQRVVAQVIADNPDGDIARDSVQAAIERVKDAPPTESDINDVAGRLASVGWPLFVPTDEDADRPTLLQRLLGWLRAGYPDGVPPTDYFPILAILHRRLTDDEVKQVARTLIAERDASDGPNVISEADTEALIARITNDEPSQGDLDRVRERLAKQGWPLEGEATAATQRS